MLRAQIYKEAESDIYKLFRPSGTVPSSYSVRETIKWIYNRGREHGIAKAQLNSKGGLCGLRRKIKKV